MKNVLLLAFICAFTGLFQETAFSQTQFLQKVLLTSGDSVALNFSEVRFVTVNGTGTARIGYGKPLTIYQASSSFASIVSASGGNLITFLEYRSSQGGPDTIALNPKFVKSASAVSGEAKTRLFVEGYPDRRIVGGSFWYVVGRMGAVSASLANATALPSTGLAGYYTASAALNFTSTNAQLSSDLTITLTGAAVGDPVILGVPDAATLANCSYSAWVSAANTVTVRLNNYSSSAKDPASGTFKVTILK
jgi:hypothetical protein